jgi:hypothetical protein
MYSEGFTAEVHAQIIFAHYIPYNLVISATDWIKHTCIL